MDTLKLKLRSNGRVVTLILVNVMIFTFMSIAKPNTFFDGANFEAILINMACDLLLACGMTIVLILAGVDLSVGAVVAFTSVIVALLMKAGLPTVVAIVAALFVSAVLGWINGLLVGVGRLAPFVATLGTQTILRGSCYVITLGYQVTGLPKGFLEIGQGSLLGLSNIIWISVIMTVILGVLLTRLKIFKQVYLVGTSQAAAFMSGIPSNRIIAFGYAISGFFAGLTGIILTSRYAMGFAGFFVGSEMRAIAAAVIGGAVMLGGEGNMFGTAMGVLLVALVNNAFIMFNGSAEWQNAISGIMLIIALFIDVMRTRRAVRKGLL